LISRNRKILSTFTEKDWQAELEKFRREIGKKEHEAKLLKEADKLFFRPDAFTILFSLFGMIAMLMAPKEWITELIIFLYTGLILILVSFSGAFGIPVLMGATLFAFPVFVTSGWLVQHYEDLARLFVGLVPGYLSGAALDHFLRVNKLKKSKRFRRNYNSTPMRTEQIVVFLETRLLKNLVLAQSSMKTNTNDISNLLKESKECLEDSVISKIDTKKRLQLANNLPLLEKLEDESVYCLEMLVSLTDEIQSKVKIMTQLIDTQEELREKDQQLNLIKSVEMFSEESLASDWLNKKFTVKGKIEKLNQDLKSLSAQMSDSSSLGALFVEAKD
jgi:hypothetical protein